MRAVAALLLFVAIPHGQAGQQDAATATPACPAQDISFFIQRFATDEAVQREFTAVPQREPGAFPVLPLAQARADGALGMRLEEVTTLSARLDLFKADTDYLISYFFKLDDCWRLVRIANQSL